MKFKDFLDSVEEFDGELIVADLYESNYYSFCWTSRIPLTGAGREKFAQLLDSDVKINQNTDGIIIILQNKDIDEKLYDLFMAAQAGFVSDSDYRKWFQVQG